MIFEMAVALTVVSIVLELYLVYKYRLLLELFERNVWLGLAFSLVLSWALGDAFGAAGVTVLLAGVTSTVVTTTIYRTGALIVVESLMSRFA